MVGNSHVSHAVNKTKRKFLPRLQNASFYSEILGKKIRASELHQKESRQLKNNGGIDDYHY